MVRPLDGKTAIVTGAARGIGRASALSLQTEGAQVIGLDLKAGRDGFETLACDLTDEADVTQTIAAAAGRLGRIDILVNNAGILEERALGEIDTAHLDRMFAVNVRGAVLAARECLPHMPTGGRIINIVSELAYLGRSNASVYCATKAALLALTRSWARELAPRILVNAVAPGPTDTPLLDFGNLTAAQQAVEVANPLNRIGKPEEVAASVVFLAGPGATLFTGQCLGPNSGAAMY
ncbi:SDR family oxidoreductase [Rhizobium sp. AG855]|uniref:SDR family NAD(P)-dependent oxidoreductase n=1 Tax=Rhizobium sp. AG855 TaxID=2183898 RepID=UPI000E76D727|nr:SDR family oxidoreductase [Rhizobium sp. AG855]RKE83360.1 3-oxoacyl-[acyl-carrier protein] reductase [Rhizobium sp. AG855]